MHFKFRVAGAKQETHESDKLDMIGSQGADFPRVAAFVV